MTLLPLVVPFAILVLCAISDVKTFTIPNRYVAILLAAWPVTMLLVGASIEQVGVTAAFAGGFFIVGFALFTLGLLGGGDAKLIAATALWVGPDGLLVFIMATTVLGGAFGFLLMAFRARPLPVGAYRSDWLVQLHERPRVMPYGVAIAGGAMIAMARAASGI